MDMFEHCEILSEKLKQNGFENHFVTLSLFGLGKNTGYLNRYVKLLKGKRKGYLNFEVIC